MEEKYELVRVAGEMPEKFMLVYLNPELPATGFMKTSEALTEAEMRKELAGPKWGRSKEEIEGLIKRARQNPAR